MQFPQLKFNLGEDIEMLRDTVHAFAQAEIAPQAAEIDSSNQFPMPLWKKCDVTASRRPSSVTSASMTRAPP